MSATVQGSMQKPQISARLSAQNLQVQGSEWKSADLSLQADPSRIVVSNGTLMNARRGQASYDATIALRNWSYLPSGPIEAHLSVRQMQVADLQHLANVQYPVSGELSAKISVTGSEVEPRGSGSLEIVNARAYDEPLKALALTFHGDKGSIVSDLHVRANSGSIDPRQDYAHHTKAYTDRHYSPTSTIMTMHTTKYNKLLH